MILLVPELGRGDFARRDFFTCGLRVLGRLGADDEARIRMAFERIGEMEVGKSGGRVRVEHFRRVGPMNQRTCIPRFDPPPRFATITFVTPAWIERTEERDDGKKVKHLQEKPSILELFNAFSSRLTSVCTLFGEYAAVGDQDRYERIKERLEGRPEEIAVESELRPLRWNRDADARGQTHKLKGVLGEVRLEGDLGPLADYLYLAQYAHVGRQAAFGLGRVQVTFGASGGDPDLRPAGIDA
ncbi:MAG: CRISPR system precrRNA processing endoribonuclease RAMP protein Cas6 [Myxococcales bacterium]|nr:CRISPR system precrRNA processing endoribonuclease RAMP protein Cas6 [Myxococcales bacterium]MCB9703205.1 CRISPR system precrRNA processing endoribonuclease RAMP protein Cas6 [Myxococcales bacterium]